MSNLEALELKDIARSKIKSIKNLVLGIKNTKKDYQKQFKNKTK